MHLSRLVEADTDIKGFKYTKLVSTLFSVFTSDVMKTKYHNRSMNKVKNLEYNR